jgi:hypothetical protein
MIFTEIITALRIAALSLLAGCAVCGVVVMICNIN